MDNLNEYYSSNPLSDWKIILGDKMHYHFGSKSNDDIFDQTIYNLYPHIEKNSTILDYGCGWGGPAKLLSRDLKASVTGITISEQQYSYIKEFPVYLANMDEFIPNKHYSCALFIQSFCHSKNPLFVLKNLKNKVDKIIIQDFISDYNWYTSDWAMSFYTPDFYKTILKSIGYTNIKIEYDDKIEVTKSCEYWLKNLKKLDSIKIVGQLKNLKDLCEYIIKSNNYENFVKIANIIAQ